MSTREMLEHQIKESAAFISRDTTSSAKQSAIFRSKYNELVVSAANILGEPDVDAWLKRLGVA